VVSVNPDRSLYSLEAHAITAERAGRTLFSDCTFTLTQGDILQIDGANGAGKTTLLNLMSGLSQPISGQALWGGVALPRARTSLYQSLAYLGHQQGLKAVLTPLENLRWSLRLAGVPWSESRAVHELATLGLSAVLEQPLGTLSAGQRQRVALARVLLSNKPLWILDEPLTALDRQVIPVIEARLREHAERGGMILLTAHQPMQLGSAHRVMALESAHA
jgi:heme exporter protein A